MHFGSRYEPFSSILNTFFFFFFYIVLEFVDESSHFKVQTQLSLHELFFCSNAAKV